MLEEQVASRQLSRMVSLDFFPPKGPGRTELLKAAQIAKTEEILRSVVDDWLAEARLAPKPADMRTLIAPRNHAYTENRTRCERCGGSGSLTGWYLITYQGNSFTMRSSVRLREVDSNKKANAYLLKLKEFQDRNPDADRQTVLSAASACGCGGIR